MEQKSQFWKSAMRYGLYLGLGLIIFSVIVNMFGSGRKYFEWLQWVILTAGVYFSQYSFRNNELGGFIGYSKCLGFGVVVMMCASIFQSLYTFIHITYIDPTFIEQMRVQLEETMLQQNLPEAQVELMSQMFSKMQTPGMIVFSGLFGFTVLGFIISLITSFFVKKDDDTNSFDQAMSQIED